ncbi:MAG: amino acid ABC transporter permease [Oscillospiraceae bacterium]
MLFIKGVGVTLEFSAIAVLGGVIFGMILTTMKRSEFSIGKFKPFSFIASAYIEIVRGTPILLQLYLFYFFITTILPLTKFQSISLALICNSAAYVSEIFRAGIDAVDIGQMEAARCLGLSEKQAMFKVVIPQAVKNILPALCNEFIMMIKETSLASTFFAGDIMTQYKTINGATYLTLEPLIIIGVIYFALTFIMTRVVAVIERRMSASD